MQMENQKPKFYESKLGQAILLFVFILATSASVFLLEKTVIGFLLLFGSLLALYFLQFPTWAKWVVSILLLAGVIPFVTYFSPSQQAYMEVAVQAGIYVAMALGLNIVVGFAGLLDLGFVAFFAIGAYTYGIFVSPQAKGLFPDFSLFPLGGEWFWAFIIIGALVAALFGILLGVPVLRVKGDYLAIVTLGFGEIIRLVFNNLDKPINITNGALGINSIEQPTLAGYTFSFSSEIYFIVLVILLGVLIVVQNLEHSKMGRAWKAIRDDEIAAQAMGVPLVRTKLWAFAIGASFSGMMGVLFAAKNQFVSPESFGLLESITILVMVILGGMGSIPGVILGAFVITALNLQILNEVTMFLKSTFPALPPALDPAKMQRFLFGIVLVCIAVFRPQGLIPAKNRTVDAEKLKKTGTSTATGQETIST